MRTAKTTKMAVMRRKFPAKTLAMSQPKPTKTPTRAPYMRRRRPTAIATLRRGAGRYERLAGTPGKPRESLTEPGGRRGSRRGALKRRTHLSREQRSKRPRPIPRGMRDSVPRIFEVLEEGGGPAAFWRGFSVDPARRGSNPPGRLERPVQAPLRPQTPPGRARSLRFRFP